MSKAASLAQTGQLEAEQHIRHGQGVGTGALAGKTAGQIGDPAELLDEGTVGDEATIGGERLIRAFQADGAAESGQRQSGFRVTFQVTPDESRNPFHAPQHKHLASRRSAKYCGK